MRRSSTMVLLLAVGCAASPDTDAGAAGSPAGAEIAPLVAAAERVDRDDASFVELAATVDSLAPRVAAAPETSGERVELVFLRYRLLQRAADRFMDLWYEDRRAEYAAAQRWIEAHADELVYGEPQGQHFVHSELLWDLHDDASDPALAERIAWHIVSQPVPGECEGYLPCLFHRVSETDGRYLGAHPRGAHAPDVLASIAETFDWMSANASPEFGHEDLCAERVESGELTQLRGVVAAATPGAARDDALRALDAVAATCDATR